jgi:predicted N-acetyltransferase YhbS
MEELLEIYHKNFPTNIRDENTVKKILSNPNNHIITKRDNEKLIAASVINKSTIIMLCVNQDYRGKGIGTQLLDESEAYVLNNGFNKINVGVGFEYLTPGVPINDENVNFFTKRGYAHSWGDIECFDMAMELNDFNHFDYKIGDSINGILYKWASYNNVNEIIECADDACKYQDEKFSKYYRNSKLYENGNPERALIAVKDNQIVGCIIACFETEGKGIGSAGCTCVRFDKQHHKIGTNMVMLGTRYLKDYGLTNGHIGYTYTGLDKLYGYSGYKITIKYMMAEKKLVK